MRPVAAAACVALLSFATGEQASATPCADGSEGRTIFGRRQKPDHTVSAPNGDVIAVGSAVDSVRYFRLELRREAGGTDQGLLLVKDNEQRLVDVFRLSELPVGALVWTRRGAGNRPTVRFAVPPGQASQVTVVRTIGMPAEATGATYYSLQVENMPSYHSVFPAPGTPDVATARAKRLADSVGFLQASYETGEKTWCCSAVAVADDLLLTNWHCGGAPEMQLDQYWNQKVCDQTLVDMSWDGDATSREYQCVSAYADPERDLALLRVRAIDAAQPLVPAEIASGDTGTGVVDLIHHPACRAKQETASCHVLALAPNASLQPAEFMHDCDSEQGSSGGPLFAQIGGRLLLVGLHHAGFRREPGTCKALDHFNRGVRLGELKTFLEEARPHVAAQ